MSEPTNRPTFVSEGTKNLKPSWTDVQRVVCEASDATAEEHAAWVVWQREKSRLASSAWVKKVDRLEERWHELRQAKLNADSERDAVLKSALGIEEQTEVAA